jgi:hypothetical protein
MSKIHSAGVERPERRTKKKWIALGLVGVLAAGGAAYAYFTTTGSGEVDAQVGTSTALTITGTVTPAAGGLVPGGTPAVIAFSADNTGEGNQRVATIHLESIAAYTDAGHTTVAAGCDTSWFSVADVAANQTIPASANTAITAPGSLVFTNVASSQDACKLAYLKLTFSSN